MSSSNRSSVVFCALGGAFACGAFGCSASADIPEVVVTQSDVGFEATPTVPGLPELESEVISSFDHPKGFGLPQYFETELYPLSAVITARGNMTDLSFVKGINLTLASRAENAPPPNVVASYVREGDVQVGRTLTLDVASEYDVLQYWGTKAAYYDIKLWGVLPEEAWAVDVQVIFSGNVSVSSD